MSAPCVIAVGGGLLRLFFCTHGLPIVPRSESAAPVGQHLAKDLFGQTWTDPPGR